MERLPGRSVGRPQRHCRTATGRGQGRTAAACQYREALRIEPGCAEVVNNLGEVQEEEGFAAAALDWFGRAVELAPRTIRYRCNLANALLAQGNSERARAEYQESLRLDPAWPQSVDRTARQLATEPDHRRRYPALALRLAKHAWEASGRTRQDFRETLAAAAAEVNATTAPAGATGPP